jgi:hypothetical protein
MKRIILIAVALMLVGGELAAQQSTKGYCIKAVKVVGQSAEML